MFKSKTLFVIGAGASCEVGLPTGEQLKSHIASLLNFKFGKFASIEGGDVDIFRALQEFSQGKDRNTLNILIEKSRNISQIVPLVAISIDNYLDAHQGDSLLEICGKLGIVRSILNAESKSKLSKIPHGNGDYRISDIANSWYIKFFQMLTESVSRNLIDNIFDNISIITFNYDRCIERVIPQLLRDYYKIDQMEADRIFSKLEIIHPYGCIGCLPCANKHVGVEFGADRADLIKSAYGIKTFTEGLDDISIINRIKSLTERADTIVFLGFAFHPMNMGMLATENSSYPKRIFATTYGLSDADGKAIEHDIFRTIYPKASRKLNDRLAIIEIINMKCFDFFNSYFRSISADRK